MLRYAAVFFVIALIAALMGFTGISTTASDIARVLFYVFLFIFLLTTLLGLAAGKKLLG